jgi:bile acid:Na+ symporter, BASS family
MNPERLLAAIMLVSLTFGSGLQVNRDHLFAVLKKGWLLAGALIANFIIVPALGVLLAKALHLPPAIATGFLLMAIAPGVPFVLMQVRKKGGSLGLAVELALFLPLISVVTVPLTAALVLPSAAEAHLPISRFVTTLLLFQVVPLLLGIAVGHRAPAAAARLGRPIEIIFFVAVVILIVLLVPTIVKDVASIYGSGGMWAAFCLVVLSLITGWLLGGPAREMRRVLAIGTALRNIGLCALVATTSFKDPDVAATVIVYFLIQFVLVALAGAYFTRTAKEAVA